MRATVHIRGRAGLQACAGRPRPAVSWNSVTAGLRPAGAERKLGYTGGDAAELCSAWQARRPALPEDARLELR